MSMHRCIDIPMYLSVVFRGHPPSPRAAQRYRKAVWDQLFGMGRLQPLFEISDAENIIVVGNHEVVVDHNDGSRSTLPPVADSDAELESQIARMARNATIRIRTSGTSRPGG